MEYLSFSFWFVVVHVASYIFAGVIALKISKDIYEGRERFLDFLRDMSNPKERKHVEKTFIPIQILRAILMSIILYPLIGPLGQLSYIFRFWVMAGLMFFYTHFASAVPFPDNIEGYVYLKERYRDSKSFWKFQLEMIIYSVVFGLISAWILF